MDDWIAALDVVADDMLSQAGITHPPVDAFRLAKQLGITVVMNSGQSERGRYKTLRGSPAVFLRSDDRPERLQWALAHEFGELSAWRVAERLGESNGLPAGLREQIANQLAARILLPKRWFFTDARGCDFDLTELKSRYPTASHSLIALRFLDHSTPAIVTLVDHGHISCRKSNQPQTPTPLLPAEHEALEETHRTGRPSSQRGDGFQTRAWPVHEPQWKREIVHTRFEEALAT